MEMKEFYYEDGLRVSVFNLDHKSIPYHWHSEVSDMVYCAKGKITIELPDLGESYKVDPGQVYQVPSQNKHRFVNSAPLGTMARYVLLQIGTFDINFVPAAKGLEEKFAGKVATPVPDGAVYIGDRKNEILKLAGRFEQQKPDVLTPEERDDVVQALRCLASNGIQSELPRASV